MYKLVIFNLDQLKVIYNFSGQYIYVENEHRTVADTNVRDKMATHLITSSIKTLSLFNASLILMLAVPAFLIVVMRQDLLIVPVIIPFIDPESDVGYLLNVANQLIFCVIGTVSLLGIELSTCIVKNGVIAAAAVIKYELVKLDKILHINKEFTPERMQEFRNIVAEILDFDRFVCL